jgi:hypothetical protein
VYRRPGKRQRGLQGQPWSLTKGHSPVKLFLAQLQCLLQQASPPSAHPSLRHEEEKGPVQSASRLHCVWSHPGKFLICAVSFKCWQQETSINTVLRY